MSAALTQIDTRELSLVDAGAVRRKFMFRKCEEAMSDLAKVLKAGLEPEMQAKFDAAIAKLAAGESLDPGTKDALKGILTMMVNFKDKLKDPHIQALAQLAGFLGSQTGAAGDGAAAGADGSAAAGDDGAAGVTGDGGDSDGDGEDDDEKLSAAANAAAGDDDEDKDATGKPKGVPGKQGKGATNKRGSGNMAGDTQSEVQAALKKQQAEFEAKLQKQHDELRKQNDEMRTKLRKQELREDVAKNYQFLGDTDAMVEMLYDFEKRGMRESMEEKLRGWNEQAKQSNLFKEYGAGSRGAPAENSAEAQLQKHADEIHKSAGGKITVQQAMMKAWETYPQLREQSRDEALANQKANAH